MGCLWYNSANKEKAFNCKYCAAENCESRSTPFDVREAITSVEIPTYKGKDKFDEWLEKECNIHNGTCYSIECLKYDVGREVAEKMKKKVVKDAVKWWSIVPDDTYGHNPCKSFIEDFEKAMKGE